MGHIRAGPAKRVGSVFNRGCTDGRRVVQSTELGSMENTYVFAKHSTYKGEEKVPDRIKGWHYTKYCRRTQLPKPPTDQKKKKHYVRLKYSLACMWSSQPAAKHEKMQRQNMEDNTCPSQPAGKHALKQRLHIKYNTQQYVGQSSRSSTPQYFCVMSCEGGGGISESGKSKTA